ncbi:MAG: hypothetical protein KGM97_08105 [Alphaproteobacteria bacterium]|nr:hypothetical protein [Alphaproteobacteria bacterium]
MRLRDHTSIVMAGLDPATQPPRVYAVIGICLHLDDRVAFAPPGHDED